MSVTRLGLVNSTAETALFGYHCHHGNDFGSVNDFGGVDDIPAMISSASMAPGQ
jgi:hypothetical protein